MVKTAIGAAHAGLNVYIDARTVRSDLRGRERGDIADTEFVFALVVDADHDKGKGGTLTLRPSLTIETSPGNFQHWLLLTQPTPVGQAKAIGDALPSEEAIRTLLEKYPNGVAAKYAGRLGEEIKRSYAKIAASAPSPAVGGGAGSGGGGGGSTSATPGATSPPPRPQSRLHVLPTIQLRGGQLPKAVAETEQALLAAGVDVFSRAGSLVYPVGEFATAADGSKILMARLSVFTPDSFTEPVAEAAIYQRYSKRLKSWVDADPPVQLVRMVLARERKRGFPRVSGIITTPTLRADGSLLANPGYDPRSELYLWLEFQLPPIPPSPTREQALEALTALKGLFEEFSFQGRALDLAVALSGLLTALLRGSLPTSPIYLIRAGTPGTGKSYLVDVIATIATGRLCPVITASRSAEDTEKRIGAVLLSGSPIVSLDNVTHDLEGDLLCQMTERPIVRIRILGRSEMPDCECRTAVFATGNNVTFVGDMVRRGLVCDLGALEERPELRLFRRDVLTYAQNNRARYVAAALTVTRAYLAAGAPRVCGPFGSYDAWSRMVRSPLVWLGESDPVLSMEKTREEDPELASMCEFFELWPTYLRLDTPYTTARIIEIAGEQSPNSYNKLWLKEFLLTVAPMEGKESEISPKRLGKWLRHISNRAVRRHRLLREQGRHVAAFRLVEMS
jgi:hypothetical protein